MQLHQKYLFVIRISSFFFNFIIFSSFNTLFTEIKCYAIKLFNLVFPRNTILSIFFFFVLIIDLKLLIPEVIAQIFVATGELVIPTGIPTKEAKAEMGTHPVTMEAKFRKWLT